MNNSLEAMMGRYECHNGTSDKYWRAGLTSTGLVEVKWGPTKTNKFGNEIVNGTKHYKPSDFIRKLSSKKAEGYIKVTKGFEQFQRPNPLQHRDSKLPNKPAKPATGTLADWVLED